MGKLIVDSRASLELYRSTWLSSLKEGSLQLQVKHTGYYCIRIVNPTLAYLSFKYDLKNAYGLLPAEFYPMMSISFWLMIVYGLLAFWWIIKCYQHADELLTLQVPPSLHAF